MTTEYWPWWLGGAGLALVALAFPVLSGTPLGVSGAIARLLRRPERGGTTAAVPTGGCAAPSSGCDAARVVAGATATKPARSSLIDAGFLLAVMLGGTLAALVEKRPLGQAFLAPEFHRLFGHGPLAWVVLVLGGVLVGFGTRWSGGCTSGHGLSGVGRLQPASLVATAVFFGVAIGVSFLLEAVIR